MKKPKQLELKRYLKGGISGVKVHFFQTGTDTADTEWELFHVDGKKPKRVKEDSVRNLLEFSPDHIRLMKLKNVYHKEVEDYTRFERENAKELADYHRLKKKFQGA